MGVSRREYARLRGVSETAVRKAIEAGRISVEADGSIDPERADREWVSRTDPARQRGADSRALAAETAAETARAQAALGARTAPRGMKAVPEDAIGVVREALHENGEDASPAEPPGAEFSFQKARTANEIIKAKLANVKLRKNLDELVDRPKAQAHVFDLGRQERDSWIGWPSRIAANMAAELGVDAHTMEDTLDRYLREHLETLSEIRIDLRTRR